MNVASHLKLGGGLFYFLSFPITCQTLGMILINKDNPNQDIILTLSELTTIDSPVYLLVLANEFTKNKYRFILQNDLSPNLNRYDHYQISTDVMSDLEIGDYTYAVYQSATISHDESVLGNPIETGKAKVIAPDAVVQPIIYTSDKPTEIFTYKK